LLRDEGRLGTCRNVVGLSYVLRKHRLVRADGYKATAQAKPRFQCCMDKHQENLPAHRPEAITEGLPASSVEGSAATDSKPQELTSPGVRVALAALSWYRLFLSPLMPNTCRFLPSCSQYSIEAYKQYGILRGSFLTAWRLARCSPLNFKLKYQGKYDPPVWPPVGLEWLFH
jgi:putative membrane protein insertion efficiency factor